MTSPAVPGAINLVSLTGDEIVPITPKGQGAAQTTTQRIANLAGGGATGPTGPAGATGPTGATGASGGGLAVNPLVTAHSGGGQVAATQLSTGYSPIAVAADSDSLALPAGVAPSVCVLVNTGSNLPIIFAKNGTSDTLNGQPNSTAFDLEMTVSGGGGGSVRNATFTFICPIDGQWFGSAGVD